MGAVYVSGSGSVSLWAEAATVSGRCPVAVPPVNEPLTAVSGTMVGTGGTGLSLGRAALDEADLVLATRP
eukprot:1569862-Prorocentrum_lima.AAC.1